MTEPPAYRLSRSDEAKAQADACRQAHAEPLYVARLLRAAGLSWQQLDSQSRDTVLWLGLWGEKEIDGVAFLLHRARQAQHHRAVREVAAQARRPASK